MRAIITFLLLTISSICFAQNANVQWGEEFKMKKGSTDLSIIHVDESGLFMKESHIVNSGGIWGAEYTETAGLVKLDKGFNEIFRSDYEKLLKGKEFVDFYFINKRFYLFATEYKKKEKSLTLSGIELSKADGKAIGEWIEMGYWEKDEKKDDLNVRVTYSTDSTKIIAIGTILSEDREVYNVKQFQDNLKPIGKDATISNNSEKNTFVLENIIIASNGNIIVVGRVYEYLDIDAKKPKNLNFKNYSFKIYNSAGKFIKSLNTEPDGKQFINSFVSQMPDKNLLLTAFYKENKTENVAKGIVLQKINPATGEVLSTKYNEVNLKAGNEVVVDKDDKKVSKIEAQNIDLARDLKFKSILFTERNEIVVIGEGMKRVVYEERVLKDVAKSKYEYTTHDNIACGNLLVMKIDSSGNLAWSKIIPKLQEEQVRLPFTSLHEYNYNKNGALFTAANRPYFAGFNSCLLPEKNKIVIMFNDDTENAKVIDPSQKIKKIMRFAVSELAAVYLDLNSGELTRKTLYNNSKNQMAMPRFGSVIKSDFYLIGKEDRAFGKTKIALGKITFK